MTRSNREAGLVLSSDAVVLLVIVGLFNWLTLYLLSTRALLDFSALYTSGGLILEGHRHQLFDLGIQFEFQHRTLGMMGSLPFFHVAYESLLFVPLALLPFKFALWLWRLISIGLLIWSSRLLAEIFGGIRSQVLLLTVALFPVALAIIQGQDSILLLLLLTLSIRALNRNEDRLGGALLSLALFKPNLVLPIAVILMWRRGYRFSQGFLAGGAMVLLVSVGLTGAQGWRQMIALMRYTTSIRGDDIGWASSWSRLNLAGFVDVFGFGSDTATMLTLGISAALVVVVAWRLRKQRSATLLFPPLVALALLTSIHVNLHDLALLVIPMLALLVRDELASNLCVGLCFGMMLFMISGPLAFFVLISAVLFLTLRLVPVKLAETGI